MQNHPPHPDIEHLMDDYEVDHSLAFVSMLAEAMHSAQTWKDHPEAFRALMLLRALLNIGLVHPQLSASLVDRTINITELNNELHLSIHTRMSVAPTYVYAGRNRTGDAIRVLDRHTSGWTPRKIHIIFESIHEDPLTTEEAFARRQQVAPQLDQWIQSPAVDIRSLRPVAGQLLNTLLRDGYVPEMFYTPPTPNGFRLGFIDPDGDCRITVIYTPTLSEKLQ